MEFSISAIRYCAARLTVIAILAGAICGAADIERSTAAERPAVQTTGSMRVRVLDSAGQKLTKAKLFVSIWTTEKGFKKNRDYTCDEGGEAAVKLPTNLEILRIWAKSPGYAPMFAQLWPQARSDVMSLREEFTFKLTKGTTMGGYVKNDEGQPIAGARIEVRYDSGGKGFGAPKPTGYDTWLANGDEARVTDADGRWSLDNVPPGKRVVVQLKLSHPDYVNDTNWGGLQKEQNVTSQQLRDKSASVVMHRGYVLKGRVTDPEGKPVKNAVIIWGDRPYWDEGSQEIRSDGEGNYQFVPLAAGPKRVTIAAEGWMPQMKKIEIGPGMPPVDFQLKEGKKLRVKFVDAAGKPVPKVSVYVSKWRGAESLYSHRHPNVVDLKIPLYANDEGLYEWTWAPDDAVEFSFGKQGYAAMEASITADDKEHVETLQPIFHIAGTVSDATTGKPIEKFRVVPMLWFRPDFPFMERSDAQDGKAGKFDNEFSRTDVEHGLQIEAPGYVTYRTDRRYRVGDPSPLLDIRLQPTERYAGTVVDSEGRPIRNARVYLATNVQHLNLYNLDDRDGSFSSNYQVATDDKGRFEIVPQKDRYGLVVIAPAGYAEVHRVAAQLPGELRLEPWAKVDGRVVQDGNPMPNCEVFLEPISFVDGERPRIDLRLSTQTNRDGSFAFKRVPPIACRVRPYLHFSSESPLKSSQSVPLKPAPGSETHIEPGGGGAEVVGQFAIDPPREPFDYHFSLTFLVAKRAGIDPPEFLAIKGFDWRKGWSDSWFQSQEGGAYLNTLHNWFVKPDPNGQFRISGVPPGEYELAVNLYGTTEGCLVHPVAQRVVPVTIAAGQTKVPLGKVVIATHDVPKVGDLATNFEFESPDGKPTNLAAQRGKYVLVDFWATWCSSCVAKLPELEVLRKDFSDANRLIVVGANLDSEPGAVRDYLKKNPLAWHHALLGEWSSTDIPKRYGVSSMPAYVLIDPNGRIAALEYSTDKLRERLDAIVRPR